MKKIVFLCIGLLFTGSFVFGESQNTKQVDFSSVEYTTLKTGIALDDESYDEPYSFNFLQVARGVNLTKYERDKRLRNIGIIFFSTALAGATVGGILIGSGTLTVTGAQAGKDLESANSGAALVYAGSSIAGVTGLFLIPGIVMWIVGDLRMNAIIF